jgi:hypothetical protein
MRLAVLLVDKNHYDAGLSTEVKYFSYFLFVSANG